MPKRKLIPIYDEESSFRSIIKATEDKLLVFAILVDDIVLVLSKTSLSKFAPDAQLLLSDSVYATFYLKGYSVPYSMSCPLRIGVSMMNHYSGDTSHYLLVNLIAYHRFLGVLS